MLGMPQLHKRVGFKLFFLRFFAVQVYYTSSMWPQNVFLCTVDYFSLSTQLLLLIFCGKAETLWQFFVSIHLKMYILKVFGQFTLFDSNMWLLASKTNWPSLKNWLSKQKNGSGKVKSFFIILSNNSFDRCFPPSLTWILFKCFVIYRTVP